MPLADTEQLQRALRLLGELLAHRGVTFRAAILGGSAMLLGGWSRRVTKDVDVVARVSDGNLLEAHPLPEGLLRAIREVGAELGLGDHWLNAGPAELLRQGLPQGFLARCQVMEFNSLTLHVASRFDLIHFRVYAAADHGPSSKHVQDLRALAPQAWELAEAASWCRSQDPSAGFQASLEALLAHMSTEDGRDRGS
jgi:hypothetical protein